MNFSSYICKAVCLLFFSLGWACQAKEPELLIPLEKAAAIVIDVHTAENAALSLYGTRKDSFMMLYYEQISKIHDIDSTTLQQLLVRIRNNPAFSQEVYEEARRQFDEQYPNDR